MGLPTVTQLLEAARRGDPLADAVAAAIAEDPAVRRDLEGALGHGSAAARHPAVRALVHELETVCGGAGADVLDRAAEPTFTASMGMHVFDVGAGALISSYRPPHVAEILTGTGRLLDDSWDRLVETTRWLIACSLPGGTRPARRGYVTTAHVRVGHAVVRRAVARHAPPADGTIPLSQLDELRTWLDFTLVAPRCGEVLGSVLTPAEYADFLRFWRHLGGLLGLEPALLEGVVDRGSAQELQDRIHGLTPGPNEASRTLTASGLDVLARGLVAVTPIPRFLAVPLVAVVARAMHGDELADALGIAPHPVAVRVVPALAGVVRARRNLLRRSPRLWAAWIARNTAANERFLREGSHDPAPVLA